MIALLRAVVLYVAVHLSSAVFPAGQANITALNLQPFSAITGGFLIRTLFRRTPFFERRPSGMSTLLVTAHLGLLLSWLCALLVCLTQPGSIDPHLLTGK
jgi:hypothetical protein